MNREGVEVARVERVTSLAARARVNVVEMCRRRGRGYAGQGMELADILAALFGAVMDREQRGDRFVLSTGHDAIALFALLGALGEYDLDLLRSYGADGSVIAESPLETQAGFEITGGSLGQGLSQAVGLALASQLLGSDARIFCEVSDGELQEGQTWEAVMAAGHFKLHNLVVLVDNNDLQADGRTAEIMTVEPVHERLAAFGLNVVRLDGHDVPGLLRALDDAVEHTGAPTALVCDTVPGRGSSTLETFRRTHYVNADAETWERALQEVTSALPTS